jgi:hypothetical protein
MIRLALLSELCGRDAGQDPHAEPIRRVAPQLHARGVALVRQTPDVILVDGGNAEAIPGSCPVILFDKSDGGMLWWNFASHGGWGRRLLKSPRVLGMLKLTRYTRAECYNHACAEDAYHIEQIYRAANGELPRPGPAPTLAVGDRDLSRIEVGYGFWAFHCCDPLPDHRIDDGQNRELDVFCALTMAYTSPGVTYHRRLAVEKLEQLRHLRAMIVRGRCLPSDVYLNAMRQARVCVSPWGWGETTIRDYEAMYAGCVLIKPRTDFIHSWPVIDERHYVPCAVDFADLPAKIAHVLANWEQYHPMRVDNRERLLALRRPEALADRLAALIHRWTETIA